MTPEQETEVTEAVARARYESWRARMRRYNLLYCHWYALTQEKKNGEIHDVRTALESHTLTVKGRPISTAPRDAEIKIRVGGWWLPAYWDEELQTFVLSRPVHIESVREPDGWMPLPLPNTSRD